GEEEHETLHELAAFGVTVEEVAGAPIAGCALDGIEQVLDHAVRPSRFILNPSVAGDHARVGIPARAPLLAVEQWRDHHESVLFGLSDPCIAIAGGVLARAVHDEHDTCRGWRECFGKIGEYGHPLRRVAFGVDEHEAARPRSDVDLRRLRGHRLRPRESQYIQRHEAGLPRVRGESHRHPSSVAMRSLYATGTGRPAPLQPAP